MEYDLSTIRPLNGYHLIQLDADYTEFETKNGLRLQVGTTTEDGEQGGWMGAHFGITGRILATPETLNFNRRKLQRMKENKHGDPTIVREWAYLKNTSLEVLGDDEYIVGDKVWFLYLEQISATTEGRIIEVKNYGTCAFMMQDKFLACHRFLGLLGPPFPVNGWVWVVPDSEPDLQDRAGLLTTLHKKETVKYGTVAAFASPVEYLDLNYSDGLIDGGLLKKGCRIAYNSQIATPLEHEYHQSEGLENILKIRRKDIFFVQ